MMLTQTVTIPIWKLGLMSILSVILWELVKYGVKDLLQIAYYKRESIDITLKVKVYFWDWGGRLHFEEQGYTRKLPPIDFKDFVKK
jgi:hypothetical protein